MQRNLGTSGRVVRAVAGLVIGGLGFYFESWWGLIGLMPLFTALTGWCPPCSLLGIKACSVAKEPPEQGADEQ